VSTVLLAGPARGAPGGQLTKARQISMTWHTTAPDELTFQLAGLDQPVTDTQRGLHEQAALLVPLATDVHVVRDRRPILTGRLGRAVDDFGPSGHTRSYTVGSTIGLLDRRIWHTEPSTEFTHAEQATIVKALVDAAQAQPGGNLGIDTTQLAATGVTTSRTVAGRAVIGSELRTLSSGGSPAAGQPGFDYDITPGWTNRTLQLWAPSRGVDRGVRLEWYGGTRPRGNLLASLTRTLEPSSFANSVGVSGGSVTKTSAFVATNPDTGASQIYTSTTTTPLDPVYLAADDVATAATGRWEAAAAYPDVTTLAELQADAAAQLLQLAEVVPTYTATLRPNAWGGPEHIFKGDVVTVAIRSGPLAEEVQLRVSDLKLDIDANGTEVVELTLGTPTPSVLAALASSSRRLAILERRA
jgi:hypothetical protein